MGEQDPWFDRMRARFRLEHGLLLGGAWGGGKHPGEAGGRRSAFAVERGMPIS